MDRPNRVEIGFGVVRLLGARLFPLTHASFDVTYSFCVRPLHDAELTWSIVVTIRITILNSFESVLISTILRGSSTKV